MPSSFSALRSSSTTDLNFRPTSQASAPREKLRRKSTIDPRPTTSPKQVANGEPVPPPPPPPVTVRPLQKSRTWGDRLSAFFSSSDVPSPQQRRAASSSHRKSVVAKGTKNTMAPAVGAPPPPPYRLRDPSSPTGQGPSTSPPLPPVSTGQPDPNPSNTTLPSPQIVAPIPPSPEVRRATLTKQEPAAKAGTQRNSPPAVDPIQVDEPAPKPGKLQKSNTSRRNSLEQAAANNQSSSNLNGLYMLSNESRGRRSVSAQTPSAPQSARSGSNSRVSSFTAKQGTLSVSDGAAANMNQSPSRGRIRRSWLPGGNRSRSNSTDAKNGDMAAWVLADDNKAEYNPHFLRSGDKVKIQKKTETILLPPTPSRFLCGFLSHSVAYLWLDNF